MRLSTLFQYCLISLTSQCALLASRKASQASTLARSPCDLNTSIAVSSSLMRRCRIASSSSRATCSGQNFAPCAIMPSISAGGGVVRRLDRDGGDARRAIDIDADETVADAAVVDGPVQRRQRDALAVAVAFRGRGEFLCALRDLGFELAVRHDLVDQAPLHRALALDAFLDGAEEVGVIAAHLALVDHARQPAGARQHRQQRHFRQRHGGRTIVGEDDVIGGQRQFIAAAGRGAVDDGDEALAGIFG